MSEPAPTPIDPVGPHPDPRPASQAGHAPGVRDVGPEHVLAVRLGHGANCSSIGSVVDTLFATGTLGVVVFAMIAAAMRSEPVAVVRQRPRGGAGPGGAPPEPHDDDRGRRD